MASGWPKWADMNWLRLLEGPADHDAMDIAPTMKHITVKGEKYFRMPDSRATRQDGDPDGRTEQGGAYLWDGWWEQKLAEIQAAKAGSGKEAAQPEPLSAVCTGPDCGQLFMDSETDEYLFATRERMEKLLDADGWQTDPVLCPACQEEGQS